MFGIERFKKNGVQEDKMTMFNGTRMNGSRKMVKLKVKNGWFRTKEVEVPKDDFEQNRREYEEKYNIKDVQDVQD